MSRLEVLTWPHSMLDTPAQPVSMFDDELRALVSNMFETMVGENGIGLAANQVGVLKRVLVICIPYADADPRVEKRQWWHDKRIVLINPKITKRSNEKCKYQEGCLSFPDIFDFVQRHQQVSVSAQDEYGAPVEFDADELLAIAIQHEIDHLDGVVFFKRMSRLKAGMIRQKMARYAQTRPVAADA
jgi:peptide deformylase